MLTGKVKYTKEFNHFGLSEWIGIELDLDGALPNERLAEAKKIVLDFYEANKPSNEPVAAKPARHDNPAIDDAINEELRLCYAAIDAANSQQDCYDISKRYGFHLRPEVKEYIQNKFKN